MFINFSSQNKSCFMLEMDVKRMSFFAHYLVLYVMQVIALRIDALKKAFAANLNY